MSADYGDRVRALYRLPRVPLAAIYRAKGTHVWAYSPPEKWSKDELVDAILDCEYPARNRPATPEVNTRGEGDADA